MFASGSVKYGNTYSIYKNRLRMVIETMPCSMLRPLIFRSIYNVSGAAVWLFGVPFRGSVGGLYPLTAAFSCPRLA